MSRDVATESQNEVVRVQEQLMEMLRSAGNEAPPPRREPPQPPAPVAAVATPAASAPAVRHSAAPPPPGTECPKCGSDKPWGKSSWCPDCGYYPKAGFEGTGIAVTEEEIPVTLLDVLPEWVMPTVVGAVGIFVSSIITRFVFEEGLQRALVALTQMLVFVGLIVAVHLRATFLAIKDGRSWMALVNFGETWKLMLDKMPKSKPLIMLLGWSFAGMGSAFLVGLDVDIIAEHIAQEVKKKPKVTFKDIIGAMSSVTKKAFGEKFENKNVAMAAMGQLIQATGQISGQGGGAPGADDLEGAIGSLAGTAGMITDTGSAGTSFQSQIASSASNLTDVANATAGGGSLIGSSSGSGLPGIGSLTGGKLDDGTPGTVTRIGNNSDDAPTGNDGTAPTTDLPKVTLDLILIGYTANPEGEVRSLLLAIEGKGGKLRYAQKLALDRLKSEELAAMTSSLKAYRIREPVVDCPYGGKWIKPVVKCRIEHDGDKEDVRPTNPVFRELIYP